MDFDYENSVKNELIVDAFKLHKLDIEKLGIKTPEIKTADIDQKSGGYFYRNKYNYTFAASQSEDASFSVTNRNSHTRKAVNSISLPKKEIDSYSKKLLQVIKENKIHHCNNLLIRCSETGAIAARLYIRSNNVNIKPFAEFENLEIREFDSFTGKAGGILKSAKSLELHDSLLGNEFSYSLDSFFQINKGVYEKTLLDIKQFLNPNDSILDFYAGIGSIGLTAALNKNNTEKQANEKQKLALVDIDRANFEYAKRNAKSLNPNAEVILKSAKQAKELINRKSVLILDPPRAGLDSETLQQILKVKPVRIIYLSCNPTTQARDIKALLPNYKIIFNQGYNYFCRTPHVEHLIALDRKI